ncbi:hypothetical protein GX50_07399 [[Emmonsia] crescens]|uniref:Uncharacterized protein n=1 Tax=[Emmonsia] crescens TaxID=73230 RepID=A0A2B7Z8Z7_9EURO|nr:hypothetical protein GX50_07399 [Emmonsia crescens]
MLSTLVNVHIASIICWPPPELANSKWQHTYCIVRIILPFLVAPKNAFTLTEHQILITAPTNEPVDELVILTYNALRSTLGDYIQNPLGQSVSGPMIVRRRVHIEPAHHPEG